MIVLDASAVVELLLSTPRGLRVAARIASPSETLHAPHLIDVEVAQVFRRLDKAGQVTPRAGSRALRDLRALDLARYPHDVLLDRIWQLRHNATAYDAAYLALAEALQATLVTFDARLSGVPGTSARVEVL